MAIKLADTLAPMADFPAVMAEHTAFADGETLQKKLDDGTLGSGGASYVQLSQEEYDALSDEEKVNGTEYRTYDTGRIFKLGVEYGAYINDTSDPSSDTVWSSKKTSDALAKKLTKNYASLTDANTVIDSENGLHIYRVMHSCLNIPVNRIGVIISNNYYDNAQYIRITQTYMTNDDDTANGLIYMRYGMSNNNGSTYTWSDWRQIGCLNDTKSSTTSTYSSAKIDEKYGAYTFGTASATQWLKLTLGNSSKFQPIIVSDQYGGKVEITGMADDGTYKPVKIVRHSYGDWTTYSATDYTLYDGVDPNYKIQRLFYYPTNGCYYLEIRQWCTIKVSGAISKPEMVTSLPVETSAMTLIPESRFATKKDIDGTFIKTTTTTGSEYYGITFKDKQFERGNNQGILIQHNRLNFEPVTFIFSASSYNTTSYERDNYDVTKINGATYNSTSPYMMHFYMDKTNNTLYLSVPSYSGVTLMDLQFKSDTIIYTKVDTIPDTATKITVTEYVTKHEMPTTHSLTLKSGYNGYITEVYDPTTKVVVYNVNVSGTFKGLLNSVADGFRVPKGSTSSSDVMHQTIGMYGSSSAMIGDAQFTRLLVRNYGNPHLEVDVNAENTVVSGTITYVTA